MKRNTTVNLERLTHKDREWFILENQRAFKYGATEEFGLRDDHFEDDGEIISRKTIERCIDGEKNEAYIIMSEGEKVGGLVLLIDTQTNHNHLELLFTLPEVHSRGIGYSAWCEVEALHPETEIWETGTPYFETRNIHFYVNRCGFHIVEFYNKFNPEPMPEFPDSEEADGHSDEEDSLHDGFFRFQKVMKG